MKVKSPEKNMMNANGINGINSINGMNIINGMNSPIIIHESHNLNNQNMPSYKNLK